MTQNYYLRYMITSKKPYQVTTSTSINRPVWIENQLQKTQKEKTFSCM